MRIAGTSFLSMFVVCSAYASASLPVVNIGAGSISARNAFGESVSVSDNSLYGTEPKSNVSKSNIPIISEVLSPNKPNGDLWARNNEKSVSVPAEKIAVKEDKLPEENLEEVKAVVKTENRDLDNQIAKLVELQRKADKSVEVSKPIEISSLDTKKDIPTVEEKSEPVAVNRVVVPMDNDVIVREIKPAQTEQFKSESDFAKLSPTELKKAFKKTYLSENKHLSAYKIDDRFDVASDVSVNSEGFTSVADLSESGGVRPLEIKIGFKDEDSSLSRDNYNLLNEFAGIVSSNPKRAIQVSIPQDVTLTLDGRKITARRLAIVEQVLRDTGINDARIVPVLSQRSDDNFVLRVISSDQYETLTQQKKDLFGDSVSKKTYKSLSW